MKQEIDKAFETLRNNHLVILRSETGLIGVSDIKNQEGITRLKAINIRKEPLTLLFDNADKLSFYIREIPSIAWDLIDYAEEPLTLLLPGARNIPEDIPDADGHVSVRVVKDQFTMDLLRKYRLPLLAAHIPGKETPSSVLLQDDYVVDLPMPANARPGALIRLGVNGQIAFIRR